MCSSEKDMYPLNWNNLQEGHLPTAKRIRLNSGPEYQTLISTANEIFGQNSWSHSATRINIDYIDCEYGKYSVGVAVAARIELKTGIYHQVIGYGTSNGLDNKGSAIASAQKDAVINGLRECLCSFGGELENRINQSCTPIEVKTDNNLHSAEERSPTETGFRPQMEMSPGTEDDIKLERKRRQQKKREEFLQQLKEKQMTNITNKKENGKNAVLAPRKNPDNDYTSGLVLDDEPLISTQEMDRVVQQIIQPKPRLPLLSSPPNQVVRSPQQWTPARTTNMAVTPRSLLPSKRDSENQNPYMNARM